MSGRRDLSPLLDEKGRAGLYVEIGSPRWRTMTHGAAAEIAAFLRELADDVERAAGGACPGLPVTVPGPVQDRTDDREAGDA